MEEPAQAGELLAGPARSQPAANAPAPLPGAAARPPVPMSGPWLPRVRRACDLLGGSHLLPGAQARGVAAWVMRA
jgi:hypothetical protein